MMNKLVIANWKMNGRQAMATELVAGIIRNLPEASVDVAIAPPFPYLSQVAEAISAAATVSLAAQDVSRYVADGAYTGEVNAGMLADLACKYVLVGHSERRQYFAESAEVLRAKLDACVSAGLVPVYCVGETLAERESGVYEAVIAEQLSVLKGIGAELVVAYEPVWAIGTGRVASLEQIDQMHQFIAQTLLQYEMASDSIRVLYGGSVKPDNAREIMGLASVSGALVGGASLNVDGFQQICWAANKTV